MEFINEPTNINGSDGPCTTVCPCLGEDCYGGLGCVPWRYDCPLDSGPCPNFN